MTEQQHRHEIVPALEALNVQQQRRVTALATARILFPSSTSDVIRAVARWIMHGDPNGATR